MNRRQFLALTGVAVAAPSLPVQEFVYFAPFDKYMPIKMVGVSPLYTTVKQKCFEGPLTIKMAIKAWKTLDA